MRKAILFGVVLGGLMAIFSGAAGAQARTEVFGGYSYFHIDDAGVTSNINGGTGSIALGLVPLVSVVGDFGGYHGGPGSINGNMETYLFGPKVQVPVGTIHPFAQVLFGGAHLTAAQCVGACSQNSFTTAVGGGLDADVTRHIGIRVIQAEYLRTQFTDNIHNKQNNARISAGVTLRF